MYNNRFYFANPDKVGRFINRWDVLLLILIFFTFIFLRLGRLANGHSLSVRRTKYRFL